MGIPYNSFVSAFLAKITEYKFLKLADEDRDGIVLGYFRRALPAFKNVCEYDFSKYDEDSGRFTDDFKEEDIEEIIDIVSEGMVVQWLKAYLYNQEILENVLNTRDFTTYSPSELLLRVGNAYEKAQRDFIQMIREYSYNHGDLSGLHI